MSAALPQDCPDWCESKPAGHQQALGEGCTVEESRVHSSTDLIGASVVDEEDVRWNLWLRSDPGPDPQYWGRAFLELETHRVGGDRYAMRLRPSDARSLARQLLHLADATELHP